MTKLLSNSTMAIWEGKWEHGRFVNPNVTSSSSGCDPTTDSQTEEMLKQEMGEVEHRFVDFKKRLERMDKELERMDAELDSWSIWDYL